MSDARDLTPPEAKPLTPANQNPWYVLMTLYGEQEGEFIDQRIHELNRASWNAWACQGINNEDREKIATEAKFAAPSEESWSDIEPAIKIRHQREWVRRNGMALPYPGFPQPTETIMCLNNFFDKILCIQRFIFRQNIRFTASEFQRSISSRRAYFEKTLIMDNTKIALNAIFDSARFARKPLFNNTSFQGNTNFSNCIFLSGAWFVEATFTKQTSFDSATFASDVWFSNAKFEDSVTFTSTLFQDESRFISTVFSGLVGFVAADFKGFVNFSEARFGKPCGKEQVFLADCVFSKPVSFRDAYFFSTYPDFTGTSLHEKATFPDRPENWPAIVEKEMAEQAKASCAVIRHSIGRQGLPEPEHFFFRREMAFAAQIGGWWQRLPYRLFGLFSDFGYSIERPALWLLGMFFVVGMFNHVVLQWGASLHGIDYHPAQAFALAFSNEFPLFGLQARWLENEFLKGLNPWLKFLGGVQTVFALPLFFFLGLGLRTRFRMR